VRVREALAAEPSLAAGLVSPGPEALMAPLVSPPLDLWEAEGLDLILEGFLLHHGRPRHLRLEGRGRQVLAGDYCYAQGLVRVAAAGDLFVIEALADLIALGPGLVAGGRRDGLAPLWLTTAAAIVHRRGGPGADDLPLRFAEAKVSLRRDADLGPLEALARELPASAALEAALEPAAVERGP
jgi:hypothetical protein